MSELNKRFPEILLAYIADVGCEFSNSRINELSKFVSELELEIENLKTRCAAYENDLVLIEVNEMLKNKQARVQELEAERNCILTTLNSVVNEAYLQDPFGDDTGMAILRGAQTLLDTFRPQEEE